MFLPYKSDDGSILPWECMAAVAGTYRAGQLVDVDASGLITAITADTTTTPPYLCMTDRNVSDGAPIPVTRISAQFIYETALDSADAGAVVGGKLQIAAGGLLAKAGAGTFEIVSLEGTGAGDIVRGRFR